MKPILNTLRTAVLAGLVVASATAQGNNRPTAITNARVVTMEGKTIPMGMVLIRNGKIVEVGAKVKVPPGARVIDAKGGTLMPGLVSAYSRIGLTGMRRTAPPIQMGGRRRGRRSFGGTTSSGPGRNSAATKVALAIYPRQEIFHDTLEAGVTTIALAPTGTGFPGQAALLNLAGKTREALVADDTAFLAVNPASNTKAKKLLKDAFEKAKKLVEERKKPKTPAKPATKTPGKTDPKKAPAKTTGKTPAKKGTTPPKPGPTPKPTPPPKPTPTPTPKPKPPTPKPQDKKTAKPATGKTPAKKPAKRKDPNLEVLADLLEGKRRAFLGLNSATDVLHYLDTVGDLRFPTTILANGNARTTSQRGPFDLVLDKLKSLKAGVLMQPQLATKPFTDHVTNPAADLHKAGIPVGFLINDGKDASKRLFENLMSLVRHGLPADVALKAVTLAPAEMLGVADKVGSIKKGKDANLILFDGDPLDPITKLQKVWFQGQLVEKEVQR